MEFGTAVVGIDFGTATTLLTVRESGGFTEVVPLGQRHAWMPSVVAARADGTLVFGEDAELMDEQFVLRSVKQCITDDREPQPLPRPGGGPAVPATADQIVIGLLRHVKERAELAGIPTQDVRYRFACPAIWDGPRRRRLAGLATAAGLPIGVADIIDEPIAAGLSWVEGRLGAELPQGRTLVFDFGGGTLDIAVLEVTDAPGTGVPELSVLSARGVAEAGDALDRSIAADLAHSLAESGRPLEQRDDPVFLRAQLLDRARRLKELLSNRPEHRIPFGTGPDATMLRYSRAELEAAFRPQLERAFEEVRAALCESWLRKRDAPTVGELSRMSLAELAKDVHFVLLAGGMAQIPMVSAWFRERIPEATVCYDTAVAAPEESVASGLGVDFEDYHRINLPRPGFDLTLEWTEPDGSLRRHVLYPAFTPLYSRDQVLRREPLAHTFIGPVPGLGRDVEAGLRALSVDGEELDFTLDRKTYSRLPVPVQRYQELSFSLKVNGEIVIRDATGRVRRFRVDRWPVLRSGRRAAITLSTVTAPQGTPRPGEAFLDKHSHPWF